MAIKVTFTLDEATIASLARTARRLGQPKSAIVRDAIGANETQSRQISDLDWRGPRRGYAVRPA